MRDRAADTVVRARSRPLRVRHTNLCVGLGPSDGSGRGHLRQHDRPRFGRYDAGVTTPDSSIAFSQRDRALIDDLRAHGGEVTEGFHTGRTVLLLTTTGAKTGEPRIAPLVYTRDGDRYVVVASKGGAPAHPAWYVNLVADPVVTVEVGISTFAARAVVTEGAERDRLFAAHAVEFPYFVGYQKKTSRVIPVVVLERIGDDGRT
jgi:deazaflavin-dependent oxidoreductase (nitroreductase family)